MYETHPKKPFKKNNVCFYVYDAKPLHVLRIGQVILYEFFHSIFCAPQPKAQFSRSSISYVFLGFYECFFDFYECGMVIFNTRLIFDYKFKQQQREYLNCMLDLFISLV